MESFDWTKHVSDRLGNALICLISSSGKTPEDFGIAPMNVTDEERKRSVSDIRIEIRVNGFDVSFKDFVETMCSVDKEVLEAAAKDVIDATFSDKLASLAAVLDDVKRIIDVDIIDVLRDDLLAKVEEGPFNTATAVHVVALDDGNDTIEMLFADRPSDRDVIDFLKELGTEPALQASDRLNASTVKIDDVLSDPAVKSFEGRIAGTQISYVQRPIIRRKQTRHG